MRVGGSIPSMLTPPSQRAMPRLITKLVPQLVGGPDQGPLHLDGVHRDAVCLRAAAKSCL